MVLRFVTLDVPRLDDIRVPPILEKMTMRKRGMVLMVGATGSGKSTTIAAMINHRNEHTANHIVTIEEPIEFLHPNKQSIVNQRELGLDTKSYARALKSAMREAPDVVVIGEIRDRETMQAAITLAGTGHLCIATLHANNASETLDRIINMFPQNQHQQLFMDLSHYLNAIVPAAVHGSVALPECDRGAATGHRQGQEAAACRRSADQHPARLRSDYEGRCHRCEGSAD
jgi:twitching motility protein PilU